MEDFLKGRPVLDPKSALVVAADTKISGASIKPPGSAAPAGGGATGSPFADLRPATPAPAARPASAAKPGTPVSANPSTSADAQTLKGEHGTKVQTIVERGRVTKIIVTCSCGKVTEIACDY